MYITIAELASKAGETRCMVRHKIRRAQRRGKFKKYKHRKGVLVVDEKEGLAIVQTRRPPYIGQDEDPKPYVDKYVAAGRDLDLGLKFLRHNKKFKRVTMEQFIAQLNKVFPNGV